MLSLAKSGSTDWWLWILIAALVVLVALIAVSFQGGSPETARESPKVVVSAKIGFCQQSRSELSPSSVGVTVRGRMPSGEYIELFSGVGGVPIDDKKFNWTEPEFQWIIPQPVASSVITEMGISIEQYSETGGLMAVVATATLRLKPPVLGESISPLPTNQSIELMSTSSSGTWGVMDVSLDYKPQSNSTPEWAIAQAQIVKKLKVVRPLFLASHSLAVGLVVLDSFFGIRFLFSGCFTSSIQSMVSAGMIAVLSIPMLAEWGQMHYHLPGWMVKIGKLNSQFKATVLLVCAVPQSVLSGVTGEKSCSPFFSTLGTLTMVDFVLFSILFVQAEANGNFGALLHMNCFKRPLPPVGAEKLIPKEKETKKFLASQPTDTEPLLQPMSPNSYAATRKTLEKKL
jgi:hypothetical protein